MEKQNYLVIELLILNKKSVTLSEIWICQKLDLLNDL